MKSGARILCVRGNPFDSGCRERSAGLKEGLRGADVHLEEVDGRWDAGVAEAEVQRWLASPLRHPWPVQAVVAQDDVMAMGARLSAYTATLESGPLAVVGKDPALEVAFRRFVNVFVNGEMTREDLPLEPGDRVHVVPSITGGC